MKKIFNTILVSLFLLIVTAGASFADVPSGLEGKYTYNNGTVTLNANVTLNSMWIITGTNDGFGSNGDGPVTAINLNGYTITPGIRSDNPTAGYSIYANNGSSNTTLNIYNGKLNWSNMGSNGVVFLGSNAKVKISNITSTSTPGDGVANNQRAYILPQGSSLTVENSNITVNNTYGFALLGTDSDYTTTLNIVGSTITGNNASLVTTNANYDQISTYDINITSSSLTSNDAATIYSANKNTNLNITSSTLTGAPAIFARGGSIILDNSKAINNSTITTIVGGESGYFATNDAIDIGSGTEDGTQYGDVSLTIKNGSEVSSTNGYAVNQIDNNGDYSTSDSLLDDISISDSSLSGNGNNENNALPNDGFKTTTGTAVEDFIGNNSTVTGKLPMNALASDVVYKVGDTYYSNYQQAQNASVQTGLPVQTTTSVTFPPMGFTPGKVLSLALSTEGQIDYFNSNNTTTLTSAPALQEGGLDLTLLGTSATGYMNSGLLPSNLNWNIKGVTNGTTAGTITFGAFALTSETPNITNITNGVVYSGTMVAYSQAPYANEFQLSFDYEYTVYTPTSATATVYNSITYSNVSLNYAGGYSITSPYTKGTVLNPGVYQLTAETATPTATGLATTLSSSVNFVINQSNTISATITNINGTTVTNPYTVDLEETRTVQFGYTRLISNSNGTTSTVTGGGSPSWSIEAYGLSSTDNVRNYAVINEETGLITVINPLPTSAYLVVSLSVDGQPATNNVVIRTIGTISAEDITGIEAVYPTIYTTTAQPYTLNNNIVSIPNGQYISNSQLNFYTTDSSVIIYKNAAGLSQAVAPSGFVGTIPVTAVFTSDDGEEYATVFELEYVSEPIEATGIQALSEVNVNLADNLPVNVQAELTPVVNTQQVNRDAFTYVSSNPEIAAVDAFGNVTGITTGTTTITSSYGEWLAKTIVTVTEESTEVSSIELAPQDIVLAPEESQTISATLTPSDAVATVEWTIEPETVATLVDNGDNTATVTAVADGVAYVTATVGNVTATTKVTVSASEVVVGEVVITSDDPDYFTVTAYNVTSMVEGEAPEYLALFAWSKENQSDINAKPMTHIDGTDNWVVENIPVNDTPINNYFDIADSITLNMYGSLTPDDNGSEIWNGTYSWVNAQNIGDNSVAYIAYSQNIGFDRPTVFDGSEAGTTQQALQMEGLRVSSGIEGVQIEANVHVQDYGWLGYVADGTYAGTMHENKQMEAVQLRLVGDNAGDYTLRYRAHVENYGWQDWVTTDQIAGTTDQFLQMEAIQIELVPVDAAN